MYIDKWAATSWLSKCELLAKGGFILIGRIKSILTAKAEYKEEMKEKISLPK